MTDVFVDEIAAEGTSYQLPMPALGSGGGAWILTWRTVGGSATTGIDFVGTSGSADVTSVGHTVLIPISNDGIAEKEETFQFIYTSTGSIGSLGVSVTTHVTVHIPANTGGDEYEAALEMNRDEMIGWALQRVLKDVPDDKALALEGARAEILKVRDLDSTNEAARDAEYYLIGAHAGYTGDAYGTVLTLGAPVYNGLKSVANLLGAQKLMQADPDKLNAPPGGTTSAWKGLLDGVSGDVNQRLEVYQRPKIDLHLDAKGYLSVAAAVTSAPETYVLASELDLHDGQKTTIDLFRNGIVPFDQKGRIVIDHDYINLLKLGSGNDWVFGGDGINRVYAGGGDNIVFGQGGNDKITAVGGANLMDGGDGADSLVGGDGDDVLYGQDGADRLDAGAGKNVVDGGAGDDLVIGGDGKDTITAGAGNDIVKSGAGTYVYDGGAGLDAIDYGTFSANISVTLKGATRVPVFFNGNAFDKLRNVENVTTGLGNDKLIGDAATNTFKSGAGNDDLRGAAGNDTIRGNLGNDTLFGGDGFDRVYGDAGSDQLTGGRGVDYLYAGTSDNVRDTFIFAKGDSGKTAATWDRIFQFDRSLNASDKTSDKIDLRPIDGDPAAGDQGLRFVTAFKKAIGAQPDGQVRVADAGAHVNVQIDIDGNNTVDMILQVMNIASLSSRDFLL